MKRSARAAAAACVLLIAPATRASATASNCELTLIEHRSGRELARLPLEPNRPVTTVSFTHSVLGKPVVDHYEWREGRAHLVEERFEGDGYGLPSAAGPGETLTRDGAAWRLRLDRIVDPLVVQPVQGMTVSIADRPALRLDTLGSRRSIAMRVQGCSTH